MRCGASQICITPPVGVELAGFVAREQPSVGLHDDLYVRGLYLEQENERLLWLHADLLAFERDWVRRLRASLARNLGVAERQVLISATHTHSGPAPLALRRTGAVDTAYLATLEANLTLAAGEAASQMVDVTLCTAEGTCHLGVDRRAPSSSSHADPALPVLCFRRESGDYVAVVANYAMHNVALPAENRHISADVAGAAARFIRESLPGHPVVLFTNGGCGNVNPPASSMDFGVMEQFGNLLGELAVYAARARATVHPHATLASAMDTVDLPLAVLTSAQVQHEYERAVADCPPGWAASDNARRAYDDWRADTLDLLAQARAPTEVPTDLQALRIGPIYLLAVGAEVFSHMAEALRSARAVPTYVIGYANGDLGYLPPREVYAEGGYEVDTAYMYYGNFMVAPGAFEVVRQRALVLLGMV